MDENEPEREGESGGEGGGESNGCPPSALCTTALPTSSAATVELDKELVPSIDAFNLARAIFPASKAESDAARTTGSKPFRLLPSFDADDRTT